MVQFISFLVQSLFSIPLQSFSEKVSTAISIATCIDNHPDMSFPKKDLDRLKEIMKYTDNEYCVSLIILDLYVDSSKGIDVTEYERLISVKSTIIKDNDTNEFKVFKLSRYTIQKILFDAVTEVMSIMNSYFMKFNEEIDISGIGEDSNKNILFEK